MVQLDNVDLLMNDKLLHSFRNFSKSNAFSENLIRMKKKKVTLHFCHTIVQLDTSSNLVNEWWTFTSIPQFLKKQRI